MILVLPGTLGLCHHVRVYTPFGSIVMECDVCLPIFRDSVVTLNVILYYYNYMLYVMVLSI